jgi:hypothetical protein
MDGRRPAVRVFFMVTLLHTGTHREDGKVLSVTVRDAARDYAARPRLGQ